MAHVLGDSDPAGSVPPSEMGTAPHIGEAHGALYEGRSHRIPQQAAVAQTFPMNRDARVEKAVARTRARRKKTGWLDGSPRPSVRLPRRGSGGRRGSEGKPALDVVGEAERERDNGQRRIRKPRRREH